MRYLKTFESFGSGSSGISGFEDMISVELSKLPASEQEKLKSDVQDLANKFGVSVEELANPDFAVKLMTDKAEEANLENIVEEGVLGDVWDWVKSKSSTILRALGKIISWGGAIASAATALTGIITASAEREAFTLWLRELTNIGELDRGVQATLCLAGLVGVIVSIIAGGMIQSKGEDMERSKKFGTGF
jgi:hypothetical protein